MEESRLAAYLALATIVLFVLWKTSWIILSGFAAIILAIGFYAFACFGKRRFNIPYKVTYLSVILIIIALFAGITYLAFPALQEQGEQFVRQLPNSLAALEGLVADATGIQIDIRQFIRLPVVGSVINTLQTTVGAIGTIFIILIIAFFLGWDATRYRELLKVHDEMKNELYNNLRLWLIARLISMLSVGILTTIGLLILGVPLAFLLGFIAGVISIIPYLGPILSAIPALLIALNIDFTLFWFVIGLYFLVQFIESNFITPIVEKHMVLLPPGVVLFAQAAFGTLFGFLGLLLASPLLLVLIVIWHNRRRLAHK